MGNGELPSDSLYLNDLFWTLQGEGAFAGRRALFVRMPFCNLACSWCDTSFDTFKRVPVAEFRAVALSEPARFAVLTGGEPMMHRHSKRVAAELKALGFMVAAETNGTLPIVDGVDWVTCSPKRDASYKVHPAAWPKVNEFKYVVDAGFDFSVLERHREGGPRLSLSPEFSDFAGNVAAIMAYIKDHPEWLLSLQTHKWINIP